MSALVRVREVGQGIGFEVVSETGLGRRSMAFKLRAEDDAPRARVLRTGSAARRGAGTAARGPGADHPFPLGRQQVGGEDLPRHANRGDIAPAFRSALASSSRAGMMIAAPTRRVAPTINVELVQWLTP